MSLPEESNFRIGSSVETSHANDVPGSMREGGRDSPQRSPTQTLVPSGSMPTALVEPQLRPCGSCPQFSIERYGLGAELVGVADWPSAMPPVSASAAAPAMIVERIRFSPFLS